MNLVWGLTSNEVSPFFFSLVGGNEVTFFLSSLSKART